MKPEKLRWGLLSTARINRRLIPPLRKSPRNKLVAVASRNYERAKEYAAEWNIPLAYGSYEALLADPEIDVVYVSLPNSLHSQWAVKALQAGKHVLCEKPLATTLEDIDAILQASRQTSMVAAEAFMYRHHAQTLKVKELIDEGAIGDLRLIKGAFSFYLDQPENVRLIASLDGGCLWDVGCYPVSYARYLVGVEPVEAFGWQITGSSNVDIHFTGQLHFPNDIYAQFDSSFCTTFRTSIEVVGSTGSITVPTPFVPSTREKIYLNRQGETHAIQIQGQEVYLGEVEDMADAVLDGKPARISLEDSRANTTCLLALYHSAKKNSVIQIG